MPRGGEPRLIRLRAILQGLVALALIGTAADLLLIGHIEDTLQFIPLGAIGLSLVALACLAASPGRYTVLAFQGMMVVMVACGAWGMVLHYQGNMEFQLEMDASLRGFDLFSKVLRAKAPPALAPSSMAWMGLLGLASTYRRED